MAARPAARPGWRRFTGHAPNRRWASRQLLARQANGRAPVPLISADGKTVIGHEFDGAQMDLRRNHPRFVRHPGHAPFRRWAERRILARQLNGTVPVPLVDTKED